MRDNSNRPNEIISESRIFGATRYLVKVPDAKIALGYDLCTIDIHDSGMCSSKSAGRSRVNPSKASAIVRRYLKGE